MLVLLPTDLTVFYENYKTSTHPTQKKPSNILNDEVEKKSEFNPMISLNIINKTKQISEHMLWNKLDINQIERCYTESQDKSNWGDEWKTNSTHQSKFC